MGGHGGLNILPQKRWNVYNYENREKVRRDEEAAAREEQLKREQSRKRDAEFRLERLRATRGLASTRSRVSEQVTEVPPHSSHLNLFEGLKEFDGGVVSEKGESNKKTKMKREEATPRVVTAEDEKYRLGYGVVGKGTKLPWYLERPETAVSESDEDDAIPPQAGSSTRKKSLQELRDERLRREKREKERQRALMRRDSSIRRNRESLRR